MYRLYLKTGNCYLAKYIMNHISKNKKYVFLWFVLYSQKRYSTNFVERLGPCDCRTVLELVNDNFER